MEIELKHLSGYLPYGLKALNTSMYNNGFRLKHSVKTLVLIPSNLEIGLKDIDGIKEKPILHPLSDLTKEIEVNGERFVPSHEYDYLRFEEISTFKGGCNAMKFIQVRELELLYEMHFDIHGLIENGLAIDINTLTK
jgi:hypothetical protein